MNHEQIVAQPQAVGILHVLRDLPPVVLSRFVTGPILSAIASAVDVTQLSANSTLTFNFSPNFFVPARSRL